MRKKTTTQSATLGKNKYKVTIYANIDYAYIVAFILIFTEVSVEILSIKTAIKGFKTAHTAADAAAFFFISCGSFVISVGPVNKQWHMRRLYYFCWASK